MDRVSKYLKFAMITTLLIVLTTYENDIKANDELDSSDYHVVYANLEDQNEVQLVAQDAFDKGASIVEVVSNEPDNNSFLVRENGWKSNTRQFYYGDIFNGSKGTITCNVRYGTTSGTFVNQCSLDVTIYGSVTFMSKSIVNNNTPSVSGNWHVKVGGSWVGLPADQYHTVPLFD